MRLALRSLPRLSQVTCLAAFGFFSFSSLLLIALRFSAHSSSSYPLSPCPYDFLSQQADALQVARYFTPRPTKITEIVSRFLIQPYPRTCSTRLDMLVLVPSSPEAALIRSTIRETWGSVVKNKWPHAKFKKKVALVFLLGRKEREKDSSLRALKREADAHGDLLVGDFLDSYPNLTRKMLAGLNWVSQHCSRVTYVLKTDQDTFVNVESLLNILNELQLSQPLTNTILGEMLCAEQVQRSPSSRVRVDSAIYPFDVYPPYVRGGSYVLPGSLVARLVNASRYMPYIPVEDAFINGVLARLLKVQHKHLPRVMMSLTCRLSPCVFLNSDQLTATNVQPRLMKDIWRALQAGPQYCLQNASWWTRLCVSISRLVN